MLGDESPTISVLGVLLGIIGILIGWIAGVFKAAWTLSRFESRLLSLESFMTELDDARVLPRIQTLESIAHNVESVPATLAGLSKTLTAIEKIIFLERGGLNILTVPEHEKLQAHCQGMFKKDLEHITTMIEQIMHQTGADGLQQITESIHRIEKEMAKRQHTIGRS